MDAKREAEQVVRDQQAAAAKKAAEEAALPTEAQEKIANDRAAEAVKLEGNVFYKAKDFPNAIAKYSKAIEMNPREFSFYTNLAAVHFEMKEFDRVIEICD